MEVNGGIESASLPPLLSARHPREGSLPSGELTNQTQEKKGAGHHGGPLPGSGEKVRHLRDGNWTLLFPVKWTLPFSSPSTSNSTRRGWSTGPFLSVPIPRALLPHWCWPAPCSPCFSACRFLHVTVAISACRSLCYLSGPLPACLFICQPPYQATLLLFTWSLSHLSCCTTCLLPSVFLSQTSS